MSEQVPLSALNPVRLSVRSVHPDLASACHAAGILTADTKDLVDRIDRPYAYSANRWTRPCTEAYVTEDGAVWYVTEGDLMVLHRLPAEPKSTRGVFFGLAYVIGLHTPNISAIEFYYFAFPDTPRGQDILRAIQCGLNRPLAYYHNPRS